MSKYPGERARKISHRSGMSLRNADFKTKPNSPPAEMAVSRSGIPPHRHTKPKIQTKPNFGPEPPHRDPVIMRRQQAGHTKFKTKPNSPRAGTGPIQAAPHPPPRVQPQPNPISGAAARVPSRRRHAKPKF